MDARDDTKWLLNFNKANRNSINTASFLILRFPATNVSSKHSNQQHETNLQNIYTVRLSFE